MQSFGNPYGGESVAHFGLGEQAVIEDAPDDYETADAPGRRHTGGWAGLAEEILKSAYKGIRADILSTYEQNGDAHVRFLDFPAKEPALFAACCCLLDLDEELVAQRFASARKQAESR